jgi:hypothetical protein
MSTSLLTMASSCDSLIYNDEGDCGVNYRVKFIDDMNLKFADAFDSEVTTVTLYVFNADDHSFIGMRSYSDTEIAADNSVELTDLGPGRYTLVTWCGLDNYESFTPTTLTPSVSKITELKCQLNSQSIRRDNTDVINEQLHPLFHAILDIEIPEEQEPGTHYFTMYLTKDTNNLHVVLQQLNGEDMQPEDYTFSVESANNGLMAYDNSLIHENREVLYSPTQIHAGMAGVASTDDFSSSTYDGSSSSAITSVQAVVADLSLARLMADDEVASPQLVVRNSETDETIISIPIIDYALLVRGHETRTTSDQDYLDRQDEYNMTFFLEDGKWLANEIIINSWRIVLNDSSLDTQKEDSNSSN